MTGVDTIQCIRRSSLRAAAFLLLKLLVNRLDTCLEWFENDQAYLLSSGNQPMPQHSVRGAFG